MPAIGVWWTVALALGATGGDATSGVQLVAPQTTRPVAGDIPFLVSSERPIRAVEFAVDGWVLDVDHHAPFGYGRAGRLDTRTLTAGRHRLAARVSVGTQTITLKRIIRVARAHARPRSRPAWADEFAGPAGGRPDPAKWGYALGPWGRSAGERQIYTSRTANVALDGAGHLRIVARRGGTGQPAYTSARIQTIDRFEPRFGRIEARIRVPAGRGLLPAFWLLGDDEDGARPWPRSGEIDVVEVVGNDPFAYQGTVHGPDARAPSRDVSGERLLRAPAPFSAGFHVYAVEWRAHSIRFLVDGRRIGDAIAPSRYASLGGRWVFDRPLHLVLNVAVGNDWTGLPDTTTPWPAVMLVDWVRAYR
ncbi:MAG TPA: glycoside hydrolase family 16 protein [Solirubrobacteraceae bacterium]|jgi:beta-glucanase (GH16 family)